jgi:hypothetical protein
MQVVEKAAKDGARQGFGHVDDDSLAAFSASCSKSPKWRPARIRAEAEAHTQPRRGKRSAAAVGRGTAATLTRLHRGRRGGQEVESQPQPMRGEEPATATLRGAAATRTRLQRRHRGGLEVEAHLLPRCGENPAGGRALQLPELVCGTDTVVA